MEDKKIAPRLSRNTLLFSGIFGGVAGGVVDELARSAVGDAEQQRTGVEKRGGRKRIATARFSDSDPNGLSAFLVFFASK